MLLNLNSFCRNKKIKAENAVQTLWHVLRKVSNIDHLPPRGGRLLTLGLPLAG